LDERVREWWVIDLGLKKTGKNSRSPKGKKRRIWEEPEGGSWVFGMQLYDEAVIDPV